MSQNNCKKNYKKAVEYFRKGAELGNPNALYSLGDCYSSGFGVRQDKKIALDYFKQAAAKGNETAKRRVEIIESNANAKPANKTNSNNTKSINKTSSSNTVLSNNNSKVKIKFSPLKFGWYDSSRPDGNMHVGGYDPVHGRTSVEFSFQNCAGKTIKYLYITFEAYNAVGDCVDEDRVKETGPILNGAIRKDRVAHNVFSDTTIKTVYVGNVLIEYMDGAKDLITTGRYLNRKTRGLLDSLSEVSNDGTHQYVDRNGEYLVYTLNNSTRR